MLMPGRNGSAGGYRYGFQGQETDDEIYGSENAVSFKYRVHDARIGRFLSVDPLEAKYPWNSPYAFSENRVIDGVELEGLERKGIHGTWQGYTPELFLARANHVGYFDRIVNYLGSVRGLKGKELMTQSQIWFKNNVALVYQNAAISSAQAMPIFPVHRLGASGNSELTPNPPLFAREGAFSAVCSSCLKMDGIYRMKRIRAYKAA
ncbi:MAG: hypothetical protein D6722_27260 [Bacteroidetes bacterium]|nr:MAG: hypothetical protein D6722_27260 [Bacteroidota bacterium]